MSDSYIYSPEILNIPYVSLPDRLKEVALELPDQDAVIFWTTNGERHSITYSELYAKSDLFAKGLSTLGFERNTIVAIATKNCPEWLICAFGTQMAGLIPLHFSFANPTGEDVVNLINGIGNCKVLIIESSNIDTYKQFVDNVDNTGNSQISSKIPTLRNIILMNSCDHNFGRQFEEVCEIGQYKKSALPKLSADDVCAIFLTSGSTGMAKAVPHTHRSMLQMGYTWGKEMKVQPGEKFYFDMPFGWNGSYPSISLTTKAIRVTVSDIMSLKSVDKINDFTLRVLEEEKCVSAFLLTPCIQDLINRDTSELTVFPLRVVTTTGLPVDALCAKVIGTKANIFTVTYGCTEIGGICTLSVNLPEDYHNYEVGYPIDGIEVKIVNDEGVTVPVGTSGEIYIRGRHRFLGYLNAKEKNEQCCDKTGWYKSDDFGFIKPNGSLVVTGRKSDMMIIGGDLVSPSHVESILKEHESVANAYVYPVHDKQTFQQAYAAILLKKGKSVTEDELIEFFTKQKIKDANSFLANRYVPRKFILFDSFPSAHSGKLDRKALREVMKKLLETTESA